MRGFVYNVIGVFHGKLNIAGILWDNYCGLFDLVVRVYGLNFIAIDFLLDISTQSIVHTSRTTYLDNLINIEAAVPVIRKLESGLLSDWDEFTNWVFLACLSTFFVV